MTINYKIHDLGYKKISEALLSSTGVVFDAEPTVDYPLQPLDTINTLWDETQFNRINLPKHLFTLSQAHPYCRPETIRVLDMPIKFPHNTYPEYSNYRLPQELAHLKDLVQKIASHEHLINQHVDDYFCYLTIDSRQLTKGSTTRKEGIHVDGFQGARLGTRLPVDHSYIVSSNHPTIFYPQAFEVGQKWDKTCHNYFEGFAHQKKEGFTYPSHSVLLMDAYCLHEAPIVEHEIFRTFLRLSYTVREFDRLGNAHNAMFDYSWDMYPRDIQKSLVCPTSMILSYQSCTFYMYICKQFYDFYQDGMSDKRFAIFVFY